VAAITAESAGAVIVDVTLDDPPLAAVSVSYRTLPGSATAGVDYRPAAGTLTFAARETQQRFRIELIQDGVDEEPETLRIELHSPAGLIIAQPNPITATIADSTDAPAISFARVVVRVGEAGGTVSLPVELSKASGVDVSVPYSLGGSASPADHRLRPGTLIIPAGSTSALLRIPIVDDLVDEDDETLVVTLGTPTNATMAAPSVATLTIVDNETAGVLVAPLQLAFDEEGGAGSYTLRLNSQPTADVRIDLSAIVTGGGRYNIAPSTLTFTPGNWRLPQTVTVRAVDDQMDQGASYGGTIRHAVSSADPKYNALAVATVGVIIGDAVDAAGVAISQPTVAVSEGGATATYTVRLTSQPTQPVSVLVRGDAQVQIDRGIGPPADAATLTFDGANWNLPQTVRVTAIDDRVDEQEPHSGKVTHVVTSADPLYNRIAAAAVAVRITDNDSAAVRVSGLTFLPPTPPDNSNAIREAGGQATYTLVLDSQPTAPVTVTLEPSSRITVAPPTQTQTNTLTFTSTNWNLPQTVTITAVDDFVDRGDVYDETVDHTVASADPFYNPAPVLAATNPPQPAVIRVTVRDDDEAGLAVTPQTLTVAEGGPGATYGLRLSSQPTATVTVSIAQSGAPLTINPATLTFTAQDWNIAKTITVTVEDDAIQLPPRAATISHSAASADQYYRIAAGPALPVTVNDDDEAEIRVMEQALTVEEGGPGATYGVKLATQPTADVTITMAPSGTPLIIAPATLTFTTQNWDTAQIVTVTVEDDAIQLPPRAATISHSAASDDPYYRIAAGPALAVTVNDDDVAGIVLRPNAVELVEGGPDVAYGVYLNSRPARTVTVTLSPDPQITADPPALTFTPERWNIPQQVTLRSPFDGIAQGTRTTRVGHRATSAGDPFYNGAVATLAATIVEPITVQVSDAGPVDEGDGAGPANQLIFTVSLSRAPAGPVRVSYTTADGTALAGSDYQATAATLVFSAGQTTLQVPVAVIGDTLFEANEQLYLRLASPAPDVDPLRIVDGEGVGSIRDDDPAPTTRTDFFQTAGPNWNANSWNVYATPPNNGYSYVRIDVPCGSSGIEVRFELTSPGLDGAEGDRVRGEADRTVFELHHMPEGWSYAEGLPGPSAPTTVASNTYPGSAGSLYAAPLPAGCGIYFLRAETSDNDTNGWGLRVGYGDTLASDLDVVGGSGDEIYVGLQQATARLAPSACLTLFEFVRPGLPSVTFHNYDLDGPRGNVRYYPPSAAYDPQGRAGGIAGTASQDGQWNNGTATERGGDVIATPEAGWWRIVTCNLGAGENHFVQEGQTDAPAYFIQPAGTWAPATLADTAAAFTSAPSSAAGRRLARATPPSARPRRPALPV